MISTTNRTNTSILTSCSSFGFVNMKSKTLSIFAIFIAARFRKNPPLIVSNGFDLALAFRSSSGSSSSNTLCSSTLNITYWTSPQINTYTNRCTYNNKIYIILVQYKIFKTTFYTKMMSMKQTTNPFLVFKAKYFKVPWVATWNCWFVKCLLTSNAVCP